MARESEKRTVRIAINVTPAMALDLQQRANQVDRTLGDSIVSDMKKFMYGSFRPSDINGNESNSDFAALSD
jgi:hypothetical protein